MASEANARTLSAFLDYLRVERGSAKLTIAAYTSDLAQFAEFLERRRVALSAARYMPMFWTPLSGSRETHSVAVR